ncbi:MAG: flavin reductase family protein [Desulfobacterota bacterium]|nr:flavin reductase family protein [Thermodesulfobacteriota bacterium]
MWHYRDVIFGELPCIVTFVSVEAGGKHNLMTASGMFVSDSPPLIAISISKESTTHRLIPKAKEFVVNLASTHQVDLAEKLGAIHGESIDKLKTFKINTEPASTIKGSMITDCFANLECKLVNSVKEGDYILYVGKVVAHKIRPKLKPLIWFENRYYQLGKKLG